MEPETGPFKEYNILLKVPCEFGRMYSTTPRTMLFFLSLVVRSSKEKNEGIYRCSGDINTSKATAAGLATAEKSWASDCGDIPKFAEFPLS